jgi:hypothetical protein
MAKPSAKSGKPAAMPSPPDEVVCEPGRHVNCLHARMAAKRAK